MIHAIITIFKKKQVIINEENYYQLIFNLMLSEKVAFTVLLMKSYQPVSKQRN